MGLKEANNPILGWRTVASRCRNFSCRTNLGRAGCRFTAARRDKRRLQIQAPSSGHNTLVELGIVAVPLICWFLAQMMFFVHAPDVDGLCITYNGGSWHGSLRIFFLALEKTGSQITFLEKWVFPK